MPTDSEPTDSSIIRTGSDGRLRYSPDQRQALLDAFDRSGMSAMSISREHGVHYQTFIAWIRKRRQNSSPSEIVNGIHSLSNESTLVSISDFRHPEILITRLNGLRRKRGPKHRS